MTEDAKRKKVRGINDMNEINRVIEENDADLERRHQEEFRGVARALQDTEKNIVLKTVSSEALLKEISRRLILLEDRDKTIKSLFKVQEG